MRAEMDFTDDEVSEWSESDFSVRHASRAAFLIDGRMTMLEMCIRFLNARESITIAAWGMTPELLMVRGRHQRAGEDGSPEQEELLGWLRQKGLSAESIDFWLSGEELSVQNVLGHMVAQGVDVRVLLWDTLSWPLQSGPADIQAALAAVGVNCVLDNSHLTLQHPIASLHQKSIVVDERIAFVGGIDLMCERDGDHDRWDTKGHLYNNLLRVGKDGLLAYGWHDVHLTFEGEAVVDVVTNFRQRWNAVIERRSLDGTLMYPVVEVEADAALAGGADIPIQVIRTIPPQTYAFAGDEGIATVLESYQRAFARAKHFIYLENQYCWRRTYLGLETPLVSLSTEAMELFFQSLADALKRGVRVVLILPDNPNVGRDFTDDGLKYLCELAPDAVAKGLLQIYTLATSVVQSERVYYRPIYVHAKVAIIDDQWVTIGSANLNNRGMRDDAELNVVLAQPALAYGLRVLLMAEHLGLVSEDTLFRVVEEMGRSDRRATDALIPDDDPVQVEWRNLQAELDDPNAASQYFVQQAQANMAAIKRQQPLLAGHLLPYLLHNPTEEYAIEEHAIKVDAANGWLDLLNTGEMPLDEADLVQ